MNKPRMILSDKFICSGSRGPVLVRIIWNEYGTCIDKILFEGNSTLQFKNSQTTMVTPHEIYGYRDILPAGIYNMGHSKWFQSMNNQHLGKCNHYKIFFYDEIIDVISEDISVKAN